MAFDRAVVPAEFSFLGDLSVAEVDSGDESDLGTGHRTGLLIIRAWVEEGSRRPLRVQIRLSTDISEGIQQTMTLSDAKAASAAVEGWLTDIMAGRTSPE